jgi:hypothetical protein
VEYLVFPDPKSQQAVIQRVSQLVAEGKPWDEIVKAAGIKPAVTDYFSWTQEVKRVPDQESFKETALVLEKGQIGPVIQAAKGTYVIRVIDRKDPDVAAYEREKGVFRRSVLNRKREQVFVDWVRLARGRAKVKIDQAIL